MLELEYVTSPRVFVIIVANEYRITLHNLIQTLKQQGYSYKIMQFGKPWTGFHMKWEGYLQGCLEVTKTYGNTLCVCMDAFDTVAIRPAKELFIAFDAMQDKVYCGVENLCNPKNCGDISQYWKIRGVEFTELEKPYLNSGCIVGTSKTLGTMFTWISAQNFMDDQIAVSTYVNTFSEKCEIDTHSKIVRNKKFYEGLSMDELNGKASYFLHFPGPSSYTPVHLQALKKFGNKFTLSMPDYHYLARKTWRGCKENFFIIVGILLILSIFLF